MRASRSAYAQPYHVVDRVRRVEGPAAAAHLAAHRLLKHLSAHGVARLLVARALVGSEVTPGD